MAAPVAPVIYRARSTSNCRVASRSAWAIAAKERPASSPGKRGPTSGKFESSALAAAMPAETLGVALPLALPAPTLLAVALGRGKSSSVEVAWAMA